MNITDVDFWGENTLVDGGIRIHWTDMKYGFGNITIFKKDGVIYADTEYMSKFFMEKVLLCLANEINMVP